MISLNVRTWRGLQTIDATIASIVCNRKRKKFLLVEWDRVNLSRLVGIMYNRNIRKTPSTVSVRITFHDRLRPCLSRQGKTRLKWNPTCLELTTQLTPYFNCPWTRCPWSRKMNLIAAGSSRTPCQLVTEPGLLRKIKTENRYPLQETTVKRRQLRGALQRCHKWLSTPQPTSSCIWISCTICLTERVQVVQRPPLCRHSTIKWTLCSG